MIDDYIKKLLEQAEQQEKWAANYMPDNYDDDYVTPKERRQHAEECRQLAEWLTELKEWKENPFRRIKAECKENYYCNNCAFIDHCPFSNGNRVAAEYPMDWVIY